MEQNVNMDRSNELPPPAAIESKNEQPAGPFMPRIAFPSPFDRTPNEPAYLLSPGDLLRMYNSARPYASPAVGKDDVTGHLSKLDQRVIDWARETATFEGWTNVTFHGYQMLLIADVKVA